MMIERAALDFWVGLLDDALKLKDMINPGDPFHAAKFLEMDARILIFRQEIERRGGSMDRRCVSKTAVGVRCRLDAVYSGMCVRHNSAKARMEGIINARRPRRSPAETL